MVFKLMMPIPDGEPPQKAFAVRMTTWCNLAITALIIANRKRAVPKLGLAHPCASQQTQFSSWWVGAE